MSASPRPFTLAVPDSALADLQTRLKLTRLPDELAGAGRAYGAPLGDIDRLTARWRDGYDWRRREAEINKLPQFTLPIEVDGFGTLDIHFVHQRSTVEGAIPLLFSHGWPGHFLEVEKILPLLTAASPDHPSFHVVSPSLPNYGFSEAPSKPGFALSQYAEVCHKLMLALGYDKYVTQGGDWGSMITRIMAVRYAGTSVCASHTNMPMGAPPSSPAAPEPVSEVERARAERTASFRSEGIGYYMIQSTRPQTPGYALADSPVGLLAWLSEKLVDWTDAYAWEDDEVIDWVMIYWLSRAGPAASLRTYYENMHSSPAEKALERHPLTLPFGVSLFPKELYQPPLAEIHAIHNVVFTGTHAHGGHFAAHEQPLALANDVRKMFERGGPAFGVVPGKDGY